jgi:hypothetical protein
MKYNFLIGHDLFMEEDHGHSERKEIKSSSHGMFYAPTFYLSLLFHIIGLGNLPLHHNLMERNIKFIDM